MQNNPSYQNDPNQQGQSSNNKGKKINHNKYYKGTSNKNNISNNIDEKTSQNNSDYNYRYNNRNQKYNNFQENRGNIRRKNKKNNRNNNNDFSYQGNNAVEINQNINIKDEYNEPQMIGNNNNMFGKNYKKIGNNMYNTNNGNNLNMNNNMNMNTSLGSMNSNTNSTGTSNMSNPNLTPQNNNQITSPPMNYNSNSPFSIQKMASQTNNLNLNKNNIYINPKLNETRMVELQHKKKHQRI